MPGVPLWRWFGGDDGRPVPVYASGLNPDAQALPQVDEARSASHRAFKIKIGFGEERDLTTLRPVFAGLGAGERVMVDINQGWQAHADAHGAPPGRVPADVDRGAPRLRPARLGVGSGGRREHGTAGGRREPARHIVIPPDARGFPPRLRAAGLLQVGWCLSHPAGGARHRGHWPYENKGLRVKEGRGQAL